MTSRPDLPSSSKPIKDALQPIIIPQAPSALSTFGQAIVAPFTHHRGDSSTKIFSDRMQISQILFSSPCLLFRNFSSRSAYDDPKDGPPRNDPVATRRAVGYYFEIRFLNYWACSPASRTRPTRHFTRPADRRIRSRPPECGHPRARRGCPGCQLVSRVSGDNTEFGEKQDQTQEDAKCTI